MLPWTVTVNDERRRTFNADISRAIAALTSGGTCNGGRLSDKDLEKQLADAIMLHIQPQWNILGVENRAPNSFATLGQNFGIERAEINAYRGVDFGYDDGQPDPHERKSAGASCEKPSLPQSA